jgi:hypothetical protein
VLVAGLGIKDRAKQKTCESPTVTRTSAVISESFANTVAENPDNSAGGMRDCSIGIISNESITFMIISFLIISLIVIDGTIAVIGIIMGDLGAAVEQADKTRCRLVTQRLVYALSRHAGDLFTALPPSSICSP